MRKALLIFFTIIFAVILMTQILVFNEVFSIKVIVITGIASIVSTLLFWLIFRHLMRKEKK